MKKAILIVDMQYDMCDGGIMANINSLKIIPKINNIRDDFDLVIFVTKLYPDNHASFKQFGGKYLKHCVENTFGANLHNDLIVKSSDIIINRCTLQKFDSNSAFYNAETIEKPTKLKYFLELNEISQIYFCGNNMDTCIFSTIMDALNLKFNCFVITDMIGYQNKENYDNCVKCLEKLNVTFI